VPGELLMGGLGKTLITLFKVGGALVAPFVIALGYVHATRAPGGYRYTTDASDILFLAAGLTVGACFAATWSARWWKRLAILAVYLPVYYCLLLAACLWYTSSLTDLR
jgi:hypothetical protein